MARFCHELGIDLWDVIRCASTKPFGFQAFYPGPGVGGHCIPIDPNYLSHSVRAKLGYPFRFVELAQEINTTMPAYVVHRAQDLLNQHGKAIQGSTVLLLGVTYKPDIADQRESPGGPAGPAAKLLGAHVVYHDPRVDRVGRGVPVQRASDLAAAAVVADLVILVQPHAEYDVAALAASSRLFFDTRGVTTGDGCTGCERTLTPEPAPPDRSEPSSAALSPAELAARHGLTRVGDDPRCRRTSARSGTAATSR